MKPTHIDKALDSAGLTQDQLDRINRYTRRELSRDEVFVFSLILCDNEIDRDGERFTRKSLEALAGMFLGKTGVFDHSPKAENQSARIFDTEVEDTDRLNSQGERYCRLRAWAYMLRAGKNEELIFEIDGGIKKEVSVGCAVGRITCSICGADQKVSPCAHQKGREYDGKLCHHLLENPTDAYEWSFVAVPAQKNAGVTKKVRGALAGGTPCLTLDKLFEQEERDVTLSEGELRGLKAQYKAMALRAEAGDRYLGELRGEVVKLFCLALPELPPELAGSIADRMDPGQLGELRRPLQKAAGKAFPPSPQLAAARPESAGKDGNPFII